MEERSCYYCKSTTTYKYPDGRIKWFRVKDVANVFMCRKCKYKHDYKEKALPKVLENNKRRIKYKGKSIYLKKNPRTGKCANPKCIGEYTITDMHHEQYHDDDPLKDTIELCKRCHALRSIELGQSLYWNNKN